MHLRVRNLKMLRREGMAVTWIPICVTVIMVFFNNPIVFTICTCTFSK
jgi:hypothetical protein